MALGFEVPEENDEFEIELPDAWEQKWQDILNAKGRIPYIYYPVLCARCGKVNPDFFRVSDKIWKRYVQPNMRDEVLCKNCFDFIVDAIDTASAATGERS